MTGEPILIVDDNAANLKLARILLVGEGYDVRTATDAEEAMWCSKRSLTKLIVMDIQLPGMDGLELTSRLKADARTRGVIILALTTYAMKGDEARFLAAGCDGYVSKPIHVDTFPGVIAGNLARGSR